MRLGLVVMFLVTGCAVLMTSPSKKKLNDNCLDSSQFKVFQVMDNAILAYLCPTDYPSYYKDSFEACVVHGDLVYLPVTPSKNDYVDEQKVTLSENECFMADGTYRYETLKAGQKTVRKIKILALPTENKSK